MVTVTLAELERRAGAAYLDVGYSSISHLRRLCCDPKVIPAVVGTRGEVLDLGRARRLASAAQCRALALRGPTDMDNLALLCDYHLTAMTTRHRGQRRAD